MARLVGARDLAKTLSAIRKKGRESVRREARDLTKDVFEDARSRTPVDQGELRASGRTELTSKGGAVIFDSGHDAFVEYGTNDTPAQPFVRPAIEAAENRGNQIARDIGRDLVS